MRCIFWEHVLVPIRGHKMLNLRKILFVLKEWSQRKTYTVLCRVCAKSTLSLYEKYISSRMLSYSSSLVFISCFADIYLYSCKQSLVVMRHGHGGIYTRHYAYCFANFCYDMFSFTQESEKYPLCTVRCSLVQFPFKKNFPLKTKWSHFNQWNCFI